MNRWILALIALFSLLQSLPVRGAAVEPGKWNYRYLFVVENTREMDKRRADAARYIAGMIRSGAGGWMGRGDVIGFWTWDGRIRRDVLPVEFWTPGQKERIASQLEQFLSQQQFTRAVSGDLRASEFERVVENSDSLTIVIVGDAARPVAGTPFDERIRETAGALLKERGTAHLPVVTRLTARAGAWNGWDVDFLPASTQEEPPPGRSAAAVNLPAPAAPRTEAIKPDAPAAVVEPITPLPSASAPSPVPAPAPAPVKVPSAPSATSVAVPAAGPAREKPLPPPPSLPKELAAPVRVEPLRYEENESPSGIAKTKAPVVIPVPQEQKQKAAASAEVNRLPATENRAPSATPPLPKEVPPAKAVLPNAKENRAADAPQTSPAAAAKASTSPVESERRSLPPASPATVAQAPAPAASEKPVQNSKRPEPAPTVKQAPAPAIKREVVGEQTVVVPMPLPSVQGAAVTNAPAVAAAVPAAHAGRYLVIGFLIPVLAALGFFYYSKRLRAASRKQPSLISRSMGSKE